MQLVWHGVNDLVNLEELVSSTVRWGECDVRRDPRGRLVLRHDPCELTPEADDEVPLRLDTAVEAFARHGRSLKLDLKEGGPILDEVLTLVEQHGFADERLWFNAAVQVLGVEGFQRVRAAHPGAILQCPVDFLEPLVLAAPRRARSVLRTLAGWGINRVSVGWCPARTGPLLRQLEAWGYEVNIYGVADHHSFLEAVRAPPLGSSAGTGSAGAGGTLSVDHRASDRCQDLRAREPPDGGAVG